MMAIKFKILTSILAWSLAAVFLGFLSLKSIELAAIETARQDIRSLMLDIQAGGNDNLESLVMKAMSLPVNTPFSGALAEERVDARTLVRYRAGNNGNSLDSDFYNTNIILDNYRRALEVEQRNSFLWAKYAQFLEYEKLGDTDNEFLNAFTRAINLGGKDYNTIKIVTEVGVRSWPMLTCDLQRQLMNLLVYAENIDDLALNQWNSELGQKNMDKHILALYEQHKFNPRWAKISLRRCGLKANN